MTLAVRPPGTPVPTQPCATGGPPSPSPGARGGRGCFAALGRGAWGASWRGGGVGRTGGRGGGEAKPAREARGARPGVHARGGLVEGTMDRGPSGREAARGSPLHGGKIWRFY